MRWSLAWTLAAVLSIPGAAAQASVVRLDGTTMIFEAAAGERNDPSAGGGEFRGSVSQYAAPIEPGPGCEYSQGVDTVSCEGTITKIVLHLGDGDDYGSVTGVPAEIHAGPGDDQVGTYSPADAVPSPVRFEGGDGDDVLRGGGGADVLIGGDGQNDLYGDLGDDRLIGGPGTDIMWGESGADLLEGGDGMDEMFGHDSWSPFVEDDGAADVLRGQGGTDLLDGELGRDELDGGEGRDGVRFLSHASGVEASLVTPSTSDGDRLVAIESLVGSPGDDVLIGDGADNSLSGIEGDDRLDGGAGDDSLAGDAGDDWLQAGLGDDRLVGGDGTDLLYGAREDDDGAAWPEGSDDDSLDGGAGADFLRGGLGNDHHAAGEGDDAIDAREPPGRRLWLDTGEPITDVGGVACGAGFDAALLDQADNSTDCEHVKVEQRGLAAPVAQAPALPRIAALGLRSRRLARVRVACPAVCTVRGSVALMRDGRAVARGRLARRRMRSARTFLAALRPVRSGARARPHSLRARLIVTPRGGRPRVVRASVAVARLPRG